MTSSRLALGAALVVALLAGCGKLPTSLEEAQKQAADAASNIGNATQNAVNSAANQVRSQTDPNSVTLIEIKADAGINAPTAYASFVAPAGRKSLLHVSSYSNPGVEGFPSIMIVAPSAATSATALAGQQVQGEVFAQSSKDGPIWKTPDGEPATIKISTSDAGAVAGEIVSGSLVNTSTGETKTASGKFRAAWRP